jgi:hypothetical protein
MARLSSFLCPSSPTAANLFSASLNTVTSTAALVVGPRQIIGITAAGTNGANAGVNVRFGNATTAPAATVNDWFIPGGTVQWFETNDEFDRVRVFNPGGGTITYYVYVFSAT